MKKYIKNLGISASIIATANTNIAMEAKIPRTGAITIVIDGKEYTDDGSTKINLVYGRNREKDIIDDLEKHFDEFTDNGKIIDGSAKKYLIDTIEGKGVTYNDDMTYTFTQDEPLKIHLKSKKYIKIQYTDWQKLRYVDENDLIEAITKDITVFDLFSKFFGYFNISIGVGTDIDFNLGESSINGEGSDSTKKFIDIDKGSVTITIDSSRIADDHIRRWFLEPADNVNFIKPDMLDNFNYNYNLKGLKMTIGNLKTGLFTECKLDKDGNKGGDCKPIITGPFKIKIDGKGDEIPSTEESKDLSTANFIHLIVDKNSINPYFLQKEIKFEIEGGKDNYVISEEIKNKIQGYLNNLKNTEEVTQDAIFAELKKLENDVFLKDGIVEKNIKCYKTGENKATKKDFGTDITVKIDPKAINPGKIKIKLTLGDIKNNENINLDPAVVNIINEKIKEVKFGISVKEILAILNDNSLKNYFTGDLVDTDILDNNGNALTNNVSKNSTIKIKSDKIKSEYFKKVQEKDKNNDEIDQTGQTGTQNGDQNSTETGDQKEKKGGYCGGYGNKK